MSGTFLSTGKIKNIEGTTPGFHQITFSRDDGGEVVLSGLTDQEIRQLGILKKGDTCGLDFAVSAEAVSLMSTHGHVRGPVRVLPPFVLQMLAQDAQALTNKIHQIAVAQVAG